MSDTAARLKEELAALSAQDRAELAQFLIVSLDANGEGHTDTA